MFLTILNLLQISLVTGFVPTVSSLTSNPGNHARQILDPSLRDELFKCVPECSEKTKLLSLMALFDFLRDTYKARLKGNAVKLK